MRIGSSFLAATVLFAAVAYGQTQTTQDGPFQIGFAANLNVGDSFVNITNDGWNGGFWAPGGTNVTLGNICVNVYVFDPQEEEIGCCACLVTPNGLQSLSAKADLVSNVLTPATPNSIVIKLVASAPTTDSTGTNFTVCNPATVNPSVPPFPIPPGFPVFGMMAWGTTLEPKAGSYSVVQVPFLQANINYPGFAAPSDELTSLTQLCGFIQQDGSGFGICNSCRLGGLQGAKH